MEEILDEKIESGNSFRIRFRYCHIHYDRIELDRKHRILGIEFDGISLVIVAIFSWLLQFSLPLAISYLCYRTFLGTKR